MRRLTAAFFGILCGGGLVIFTFHYHTIRADEGLLFVPKRQASLSASYVDIRSWRASQWRNHPELAGALVSHGRGDLVRRSVSEGLLQDLFDTLGSSSK